MSVNTLGIEQAYTLIAALHNQATGKTALAPTTPADFISVANATLQAGYDAVLQAVTQVVSKTMIAVRPYDRKFKGLEWSAERWGGITRKISFGDIGPGPDPTYALQNWQSVDQFVVKMPDVLETHYYGSDVYMGGYTIFTKQLDVAFSGPEEFAAFISGLMTHMSNEREAWLESLARQLIANAIAAQFDIDEVDKIHHLVYDYNQATGLSLTTTTVKQPSNFPAFCKWAYGYINNISRQMTERSQQFQVVITGHDIYRHTPREEQRAYFAADLLSGMTAEVLADTYHDNFLSLADVEGVGFWQSIETPDEIKCTPVYIDSSAAVKVAGAAVDVTDVAGILFDRDAIGYNIKDYSIEVSPYNAMGQYYNIFQHMNVQLCSDFTEKMCVFTLQD